MLDLAGKPFCLDEKGIGWVRQTLSDMTVDEKFGQLFCLLGRKTDRASIEDALKVIRPGGYMFRPGPAAAIRDCHHFLQERCEIPLLLAANLERGGDGIAFEGTLFATPMQVAATGDDGMAYRLGIVCGREAHAVGCNWAFSPNVDIDLNFQNPITNTRTYGSDPDRVLKMANAYMKGIRESGLAVTLKHWPGDGVDSRDQHLLTSINGLPVSEWDRTFGYVYRHLIGAGAQAVMSAHIMLPEYSRELLPGVADRNLLPASLARELNIGLLRERLGFNGLIVTDATNMAGFTVPLAREQAVPLSIAAGNDMFLFTINLEEDVEFMRQGVQSGLLSEERLDEAVARILALKASLRLPQRRREGTLVPSKNTLSILGCTEHRSWAAECAEKAVTLVKDTQHLLPLSPERHRRLLVYVLGDCGGYLDQNGGKSGSQFIRRLEAEGFRVTRYDYLRTDEQTQLDVATTPVRQIRKRYDAVIYLASIKTASNQTSVRLTWGQPMGFDCPKFVSDIPTVFISIDNPYHLQDVPHVRTFINGYTSSAEVTDAVVDKLTGKSQFTGVSPVDPFCGCWEAHL